jgi:hypothetical protein
VIRPVIGGNKTKKCSIRMLLLDNPSIYLSLNGDLGLVKILSENKYNFLNVS